MREQKIETPVREGREGVSLGTNLDGEDFGRVDPGNNADEGEEEGKDEIHGYHGTESVLVCVDRSDILDVVL